MELLGLLPLCVLSGIILAYRDNNVLMGSSVARAGIVWAGLALASAEALSLFSAIAAPGVLAFWLGVLMLLLVLIRRPRIPPLQISDLLGISWECIGSVVLFMLVAATAILSPPNTWDAMTYHMARVMHWQQQGSLSHYQTSIIRQLSSNPLAEIIVLHFQVLSGSDRFANLVQLLAYAGSGVVVAALARRLGGGDREAGFATILVLTLPMAVLQGSSAQNDLAAAFFLLAAAERLVAWRESGRTVDALEFAGAIGLALLTKGTIYVLGAPLAAIAGLWLVQGLNTRRLALCLAMAILVVAINFGHWQRNQAMFGSPLGPQYGVANTEIGIGALASNTLRGLASNFSSPVTDANNAITTVVTFLHTALGRDASDPNVTFPNTRFELTRSVLDEDLAGNPLQSFLMIAAIVFAARIHNRRALEFGAIVIAGGLLFCLMLRWQPWITRLQLPFFILAMAPVAVILGEMLSQRAIRCISAVLLVAALPWAIMNQARPLFGEPTRAFAHHVSPDVWRANRHDIMFAMRPALHRPFQAAVDSIPLDNEAGIGLILGGDSWEYPFWVLLNGNSARRPQRIDHICTGNDGTFSPNYVLVLGRPTPELMACGQLQFKRIATFPADGDAVDPAGVAVYQR